MCVVQNQTSEIPMVMANDNFWGYTSDILFRYKVKWLEAAIVQPFWTNFLVCYVEGNEGHLMGEEVHQAEFRTRVRGTAHSFQLPWQDIVDELCKYNEINDNLSELPRKPDQLKYILRVQLRVHGKLLERVLRQLTVRPYVLCKLLEYLVDHNRIAVKQGAADVSQEVLKQRLRGAVERWYP